MGESLLVVQTVCSRDQGCDLELTNRRFLEFANRGGVVFVALGNGLQIDDF